MRLFRSRLWWVLAVLGFGAAMAGHAGSSDDTPVLRFNISPNGYPPYTIVEEDGTVRGIMWDTARHILQDLGYRIQPEEVPRKRVNRMILEGHLDATPRARQWTRNPDRFLFTDPIVYTQEVFFSPREAPFHYRRDSLEGRTLLTHLGYNYPELEPLFRSGKLQRFDVQHERMMFKHLLAGERFNLLIAERQVGLWIMKQEGIQDRVYVDDEPISHVAFSIMFAPRYKALVKDFNEALEAMKASGELQAIIGRYE
ncbi:transporter substrate-binding domain-containing protein [Marinobacteraceae bacterium S3BR75-40.1]